MVVTEVSVGKGHAGDKPDAMEARFGGANCRNQAPRSRPILRWRAVFAFRALLLGLR